MWNGHALGCDLWCDSTQPFRIAESVEFAAFDDFADCCLESCDTTGNDAPFLRFGGADSLLEPFFLPKYVAVNLRSPRTGRIFISLLFAVPQRIFASFQLCSFFRSDCCDE